MTSTHRFLIISKTLFPPFLKYSLHHKNPDSPKFKEATVEIRQAFQNLGTTFIKLGQMLSARPDMIGYPLATELRNLLDKEPIIPYEAVAEIIKKECKEDIKDIFQKFEHTPIATASIGQVHKAVLKNGHVVAVKIQRPKIDALIRQDLIVFGKVSKMLDALIQSKGLKLTYIYQEFSNWITNELDFSTEGHRADKFRENMKHTEGITIPTIYWEHTTSKVLVMSYIEGETINTILSLMQKRKVKSFYELKLDYPINPDMLIRRVISAVIKQALVDKYFHGDMHPANIILQKNNKVAFVDFGIIGTLDNQEHTQVLLLLLALVDNDPQALVKVVVSTIAQPLSREQTAKIYQAFSEELHKLHEDAGGKISLSHLIMILLTLSQKYEFVWSPGFLLAAKTIAQIDSVAGQIGLHNSLLELAKPEVDSYMAQSLTAGFSKEMIYRSALDIIEAGKKLPDTLNDLEQLIDNNQLASPIIAQKKRSFIQKAVLASTSLLVSVPLVNIQFITHSSYRIILTVAVPLLLFLFLAKIFTSERG